MGAQGALLEPWLGGARSLMETQRDRLVAPTMGHRPQAVPQSFRVQGCCWGLKLVCLTCLSSPGGAEIPGQRGLVPSNFLEGPGPEAGRLRQGAWGSADPRARSVKTWAPGLAVGSLCCVVGGKVQQRPGAHSAQEGASPWPGTQPGWLPRPPPPACAPLHGGVKPRP